MKLNRSVAVAVAAFLVSTGVAVATPGNAPAEQNDAQGPPSDPPPTPFRGSSRTSWGASPTRSARSSPG